MLSDHNSENKPEPDGGALNLKWLKGIVQLGNKGLNFMILNALRLRHKYALHKLVRLRARYILTRSNRLRLRYLTGMAVICIFGAFTTFNVSANALALKWVVVKQPPAASDHADVPAGQEALTEDMRSQISETIRKTAIVIRKPPGPLYKTISIGKGDTLTEALQKAGISNADSYHALKALSEYYDPRKIRPGQEIRLNFKPGPGDAATFSKMSIGIDALKTVEIAKNTEDGFTAHLNEKEVETRQRASSADIETSLYGSAVRAGIPPQIVAKIIHIYSWNVDFQRDIRKGDTIEVLYEAQETPNGKYARYGDILYASLSVGGETIPMYRFEMADGHADYFRPDGHSVRKVLMKTPIDGARLSSGYGMRKHPVLGYNKMHKGVDFAAPAGTPIYAAGDGTIDYAGRKGGYGNYIQIRHNSSLKTAYAHMSRFARGMGKGKRIKQGEVIGYVGSTGRSTGPHLHYEVLENGRQVNPRSVDLPTGEQLIGKELKKFKEHMDGIYQQYVSLSEGMKFAKNAY